MSFTLKLLIQIKIIYSRDHKDQEGIREIWVTMEKEDRRVIEDLQVYKVFLDHL